MTTPTWVLAAAFWLHMAATVAWIGGLFFQAAVLNPILAASRHSELWEDILHGMRRRFQPIAWLSLAVLVATGLTQMEANPQYQGFLAISNRWAQAILIKHAVIALMVAAAAYQTWYLQPKLERALLLDAKRPSTSNTRQSAVRSALRLTRINVILGFAVLALTAVARTA
jgi:uncharacterized membrane protein